MVSYLDGYAALVCVMITGSTVTSSRSPTVGIACTALENPGVMSGLVSTHMAGGTSSSTPWCLVLTCEPFKKHSTTGGSPPAPHELLTLSLSGSVLIDVLLAEASSANHSRFMTTASSLVGALYCKYVAAKASLGVTAVIVGAAPVAGGNLGSDRYVVA